MTYLKRLVAIFTFFGTTRGQGIIRVVAVVLVVVATFFWHFYFFEDFKSKYGPNTDLLSFVMSVFKLSFLSVAEFVAYPSRVILCRDVGS